MRRIALDSARGQQQGLGHGRPHATRPPWGIDKLISDEAGQPLYKLRHHADGTVSKVNPDTGEEYEPIQAKPGRTAHPVPRTYRIDLVPGREDRVEIIRQIFRRNLVDAWGATRIAAELNSSGVEAHDLGGWTVGTVKYILNNPTYCGVGLTNRQTKGRYCKRGKRGPEGFDDRTRPRRLTGKGNPVNQRRPEEEWERMEYPALRDLLPGEQRERVLERQLAKMAGRAGSEEQPRSKHDDSPFILTGILKNAGGISMRGTRSGRPPYHYRYYCESVGENRPRGDRRPRRIRADFIESMIMDGIIEMLRGLPYLEESIVAQTLEWVRTFGDAETRRRLEQEIRNVEKQQAALVRNAHRFTDGVYDAEAERLAERHAGLTARLGEMGHAPFEEGNVREVVRALIAGLMRSADSLPEMRNSMKRRAIRSFVEEAIFDQDANEVSITFRIPSWAQNAGGMVGLDDSLDSETTRETHQPFFRFRFRTSVPVTPRREAA